jgi:hypothetical protein
MIVRRKEQRDYSQKNSKNGEKQAMVVHKENILTAQCS